MLQEAEEGPNPRQAVTKIIMSIVKKTKTGQNRIDTSSPFIRDYMDRYEDRFISITLDFADQSYSF